MKDYIIEMINGQKKSKSHLKAQSLSSLRLRLIKEGVLKRQEMVIIFTTTAEKVTPSTPFKKTGVIWLDNYNDQYFWMDNNGQTKNVSAKTGAVSAFKVGGY